jgi:L-asparaginase / beta-aspartyl-peptidase
MIPHPDYRMIRSTLLLTLGLATACAPHAVRSADVPQAAAAAQDSFRWGLIVHGGAGNASPRDMTPARDSAYRAGLERALRAGHAVLARGGTSVDAVQAAIMVLEDDSMFNAGRGAVLTADGRAELDAAIMNGETLGAGSVAGLHRVKNPISLARAVMDHSPHVMMISDGAERFAMEQGLTMVDPEYFITAPRRRSWQRQRTQDSLRADSVRRSRGAYSVPDERKFGTVGAVALDRHGNLAAGTSTGGMEMKRYGRVGDVPVIGAGTYANNRSCAVSATGHGEFFIRNTVAHSICALMEYGGMALPAAADSIVMRQLATQHGDGGIIAMDRRGTMVMPFNTTAMYRGRISADGRIQTGIFRD